jgi:hypothetical protein
LSPVCIEYPDVSEGADPEIPFYRQPEGRSHSRKAS